MPEELEWTRRHNNFWETYDQKVHYVARRDKATGTWRVTMDGVPIGGKDGFRNIKEATEYVDWGGNPSRMGYDRETGEVQE